MRGNNDHPSHCQRIAVTADTPTCDGSRDLVTDLRSITQVTKPSGGDPPLSQFPHVSRLVLKPKLPQQIDCLVFEKRFGNSFLDSARSSVAVCRQARKPAMSVAETCCLMILFRKPDSACVGEDARLSG